MAEDFFRDFIDAEIADLLTAVEAGVPSDLAEAVIRAARSEDGDRGEGRRRDWLEATAAALRLGVEQSRVLPMLGLSSEAKTDIDRAIRGGLDADLAVQIALQVPDDLSRRRDLMEDAFTARRAGLGEEVVEDSIERARGRRRLLRAILNDQARRAGIGVPHPHQGSMFSGFRFRTPFPFRTLADNLREQEEREERERSGPPGEINLNRLIDFITEVVFRRVVERMRVE